MKEVKKKLGTMRPPLLYLSTEMSPPKQISTCQKHSHNENGICYYMIIKYRNEMNEPRRYDVSLQFVLILFISL